MSAAFALQQSVFAALAADAALAALVGAGRIFDDVPQGTSMPYVVLGPATERDWSTGSDPGTDHGSEHILAVHVWSDARGKKETHAIIAAVRATLHEAALAPAGHRLVTLRHELSEVRRSASGEAMHGTVRFRAVTEPL
jgi:hypothetical protein